jgi:predicted RNA-binding protein with PUA-like domain
MHYWLLKTEPSTYSWGDLVTEKTASWTGVRNFQARNNLRAMEKGDLAFIYHSVDEKAIVGIAEVSEIAYPDPTAIDGDWSAVDITAIKPITPISLDEVKRNLRLKNMVLARNSRLSVQPVTKEEWDQLT